MENIGAELNLIAISDRMAISEVLYSHCCGLDRLDLPTLSACYWPDAEVDYGSYRGPAKDFAGLVIPALAGSYELTRHGLSNTIIEIRGARAMVESLVDAAHLVTGGSEEMLFRGRYLDTLEKRQGHWKLLHRQVVIDWASSGQIIDLRATDAFIEMARGEHGPADPLHTFLSPNNGGDTV